ncbi:unnamed protein product [Symbiodinium sp. CCMP2592]|nr:unnamed protein product [Symbiodinium sp. CCMP2592]
MFTWSVDEFPQLGAGSTQAPLLGCWAKKTPQVAAAPVSTVAAAPVSAIIERSSVGGPGGIQNNWKPAGSKKKHQKGWQKSPWYGHEPGSRQNNWRDSHKSFHGSAAGPNKWVWHVKGA